MCRSELGFLFFALNVHFLVLVLVPVILVRGHHSSSRLRIEDCLVLLDYIAQLISLPVNAEGVSDSPPPNGGAQYIFKFLSPQR